MKKLGSLILHTRGLVGMTERGAVTSGTLIATRQEIWGAQWVEDHLERGSEASGRPWALESY